MAVAAWSVAEAKPTSICRPESLIFAYCNSGAAIGTDEAKMFSGSTVLVLTVEPGSRNVAVSA